MKGIPLLLTRLLKVVLRRKKRTSKKVRTPKTVVCGNRSAVPVILILSNKWDLTVDFVVRELQRREHSFLRLNTEDLVSQKATITLPDLHIFVSKHQKIYDLTKEVRVIWNRRPGKQ